MDFNPPALDDYGPSRPVFLDPELPGCARIPMTFDLRSTLEFDGREARIEGMHDYFTLSEELDGLAAFWGTYLDQVVRSRLIAERAIAVPASVARGLFSGIADRDAANRVLREHAMYLRFGNRAGPGWRPMPPFDAALALSEGEKSVRSSPQIVAIVLRQQLLSYGSAVHGVFDRKNVLMELRLNECEFTIGSGKERGGAELWVASASLVVALFTLGGGQTWVDEQMRTIAVSQRIHNLNGSPCHVRGAITLDRSDLITKAKTLLVQRDHAGACARQEMLIGLNYYQDIVDGIEGPETKAAMVRFANDWKLQVDDKTKLPDYNSAFATAATRALSGEKP